jgi:hypothetical protein
VRDPGSMYMVGINYKAQTRAIGDGQGYHQGSKGAAQRVWCRSTPRVPFLPRLILFYRPSSCWVHQIPWEKERGPRRASKPKILPRLVDPGALLLLFRGDMGAGAMHSHPFLDSEVPRFNPCMYSTSQELAAPTPHAGKATGPLQDFDRCIELSTGTERLADGARTTNAETNPISLDSPLLYSREPITPSVSYHTECTVKCEEA